MEIVSLNCNNCGAPLEVAAGSNYATCGHCGARLAVRRTASATYTEVLEKLDRTTDAIAGHLATIARQNEVERVDREWERERARYVGKDGGEPQPVLGLVWGFLVAGFGVFWMTGAASIGAPSGFVLFGLVFIIVPLTVGLSGLNTAGAYRAAEADYRRRRAEALRTDPPQAEGSA
ncbi:MAG: hypothetical protein K2X82_01965 [Gemmataceae bacterium]|nr:hypothetical protein [Gemmataceae bacterium]